MSNGNGFTVSQTVKEWFYRHYTVHVAGRKGYTVTVKRVGPGVRGVVGEQVLQTHTWNKVMLFARDRHVESCRKVAA